MIFKDINVEDEISVSNLGLLLQGFKRMEERERLFRQLPSPETTFVITETFQSILQKRELPADRLKFINLIDGRRDILQIIDDSNYDDIKTLERLVKLYQQGFIKPGKAVITSRDEETEISSSIAEPEILDRISSDSEPTVIAQPPFSSPAMDSPFVQFPEPVESPFSQQDASKEPDSREFPDRMENLTEPYSPAARIQENSDNGSRTKKPDQESWDAQSADLPPVHEEDSVKAGDDQAGSPQDSEPSPFGFDFQEDLAPEGAIEEDVRTPSDEQDRIAPTGVTASSPEVDYEEAELLPIDLGEIMQRPSEPPAFLRDDSAPEVVTEPEEPFGVGTEPAASSADEQAGVTEEESQDLDLGPPAFEPTIPYAPVAVEPPGPEPPVPEPSDRVAEPEKIETRDSAVPVVAETKAKAQAEYNDSITQYLSRLVAHTDSKRPTLAVIGRDGHAISAIVKDLLGPGSSLRKVESATFQHLELGERRLNHGQAFHVIGISMEQQFTKLLTTVAQDLVGFILLVEAHRREDLGYLGYLLKILKSSYRVPFGIACVRSKEHNNLSIDTLRDLLNAEPADCLQECIPSDPSSVMEFLSVLLCDETLARWAPDAKAATSNP